MENPLTPFLTSGPMLLDGALATELERRGADLSGGLWSARVLREAPEHIRRVHLDYLEAGADCLITATYQASIEGFIRAGDSRPQAVARLELAVQLAAEARDAFWSGERTGASQDSRRCPLVAASVGPYGAVLADGSEFTGDYGIDRNALLHFHRPRFEILAAAGADLLACETIPSQIEVSALAELLEETAKPAYLSFCCCDGAHLADGSPVEVAAKRLARVPNLVALGVNCTAPKFVPELLVRLRDTSDLPLLAYPNLGETYDAARRKWRGDGPGAEAFARDARSWRDAGASILGGCCRTTPAHIRAMRLLLTAPAP